MASTSIYVRGRIEDFDTEQRYDLIIMLNLIEHVEDPTGLLEKVGSRLAKGGNIIIKTPNTDSLDARLIRDSYWGGLHCPRHWVLFNRASMGYACRRASLHIDEMRFTQGAPFWSWSVLSILQRRSLVRISQENPWSTMVYCRICGASSRASTS